MYTVLWSGITVDKRRHPNDQIMNNAAASVKHKQDIDLEFFAVQANTVSCFSEFRGKKKLSLHM